jgi:S-adenosylmethionine-diacylglycerol 3-amino-3-carboxypropyl transferase
MVTNWIGEKCFQSVHRRNLVYNTCWEDPRLDREAMKLSADDKVMVITSAGCNALDYALDGPAKIFAVDMNPLQNALLDLKIACVKSLDYREFFAIFGRGCWSQWASAYQQRVRPHLSSPSTEIWDRRINFFTGDRLRRSFYFRGSSGYFAWLINRYIDQVAKVRATLVDMLEAGSIDEQKQLFDSGRVQDLIWRPMLRWAVRRDITMSMLGVPRAQREQIDRGYPGGLEQFIIHCLEAVFTQLSLKDNYFWRVYLTGQYTPTCCPEYLKEENFNRLRDGLVDRISTHTDSVEGFLKKSDESISRFVLLDHMDWLCKGERTALTAEWQAIIHRCSARAKVLWRSAGLSVDFIDPLNVTVQGQRTQVGELLNYHTELAIQLHARDRVHTYGSFYIADLTVA